MRQASFSFGISAQMLKELDKEWERREKETLEEIELGVEEKEREGAQEEESTEEVEDSVKGENV